MGFLAECVKNAMASPELGAQRLLGRVSDPVLLERLMNMATWKDEDVQDFEAQEAAVLIRGRWGMFWLASSRVKRALLPPAPVLSPLGLRALGRGLVAILA